jgi:hypothetical protein
MRRYFIRVMAMDTGCKESAAEQNRSIKSLADPLWHVSHT